MVCVRMQYLGIGVAITLSLVLFGFKGPWVSGESPGSTDARMPPSPDSFLILAKVLSVHVKHIGGRRLIGSTTKYRYRVRILYAESEKVNPGEAVLIYGTERIVRSWSTWVPSMSPGVRFITFVSPAGLPEKFRCGTELRGTWLPLGVPVPSPVSAGEASNLRRALVLYGRLGRRGSWRRMPPRQARKLWSSSNYFLWALGTSVLARNASKLQVQAWLHDIELAVIHTGLGSRVLSPRRAFWLIHCMRSVAPAAVRPSRKELLAAMEGYLRLLSVPHVHGYKP